MEEQRLQSQPLGIDVFRLVKDHGRQASWVALGTSLVVAVISVVYFFWGQPVRRSSTLEFRPTFNGVALGQYPNGLPFSPTDVAAAPIVDVVYDENLISEYCSREDFRGGFFVEQRSDQLTFLSSEYQSRLADSRLTPVERQRLQLEYEAKRAALPIQFRLVFVKPRPCRALPQVVVAKVMTDVLLTWATQSETHRGVLNHQVEVLTPGMLDVGEGMESSPLLRADLIRTALLRVAANINQVRAVPGASLILHKESRLSFSEVRDKLMDLIRSRLEPLVATAGQSMAREALVWVTETVASAERERQAAVGKAAANREALQLYSGTTQAARPGTSAASSAGTSARDVQTLAPQIDSTFIDRIVELSAANTTFRQELTKAMVEATIRAVDAEERASYYQRLLQTLRSTGGQQMSPAEIDARLEEIVKRGRELTQTFNELYREFSRVSLRPAAAMYQVETPVTLEVSRDFTESELLTLVVVAFVAALLLALAYFVVRDRMVAQTKAS